MENHCKDLSTFGEGTANEIPVLVRRAVYFCSQAPTARDWELPSITNLTIGHTWEGRRQSFSEFCANIFHVMV